MLGGVCASEDGPRGGGEVGVGTVWGGGFSSVKLGRRNFMLECPNKMSFKVGCVPWEYLYKSKQKSVPLF